MAEDFEVKDSGRGRKAAAIALQILSGAMGGVPGASMGMDALAKKVRGRKRLQDNNPGAALDLLSNPMAARMGPMTNNAGPQIPPMPPQAPMNLPPPPPGPQMGAPNMMPQPQGIQAPGMTQPPNIMG